MKRDAITDAQRQTIIDLLPVATSLRQIARAMDLDNATVRTAAKPFLAIMRATGTMPTCVCGKERFHPRLCSATSARNGGHNSKDQADRRSKVVTAIMGGDTFNNIAKRFGIQRAAARAYLRYLTPAQRERRKALELARRSTLIPRNIALGDPLARRINAAVPAWLDQHLRDDVISETYLAVWEGQIADDRTLSKHVERFSRVARDTYTSKWGNRSIDAPIAPGSDFTIADRLADPAALAAFDRLFEGAVL
ncbi:MAG: hypothetical protein WBL20_19240 [Sphingobium sp.]|uniref:hypothetical protein n=1 Tax=Sphingobium sp. TaxID=1912891 RepID=UPI003BAFD640